MPGFRRNFQKYKKNEKRKKIFLCIWPSVSKLKKNHKIILCFSYTRKKYLSMHFGFNNQFVKVNRTLTRISKTIKILFCLSFSIRGTALQVIYIPNIKFFLFWTQEQLGFTPLR